MCTSRWSLGICDLHFLGNVEIIYWLVETGTEIDWSPLQPPKNMGDALSRAQQVDSRSHISHHWHSLPQLCNSEQKTATTKTSITTSFATCSDRHSQQHDGTCNWASSPLSISLWVPSCEVGEAPYTLLKRILYAMHLSKAWFILSSCALGMTVNYSCKASCELQPLDQIRYQPRHPEEEKKINVNKCNF